MAQNLSNLPIGAKVKFGKHSVNGETAQPIVWRIVAKGHSGYPSNSVTVLANGIIDLRAVDAREPNNTVANKQTFGNNDYDVSNIDQWLNTNVSPWYTAKHTYDQSPNTTYTSNATGYENRPGFLSNFSTAEIAAIMSTTITFTKYNKTTGSAIRKIFLPSASEMGFSSEVTDGVVWSYFAGVDIDTASKRSAYVTSQCLNNTLSTSVPTSINTPWYWWLRSAKYDTVETTQGISSTGVSHTAITSRGDLGIRPAMNLSATLSVSDVTDSDGCYTFILNSAPPVPTTLNVPTIYGGKAVAISWSKVTDPDNDVVTYQLESSVNGAAFGTIYSGGNLSFTTTIPSGSTSVQFRVKAIDSQGASSGYITSTSRTVINNSAPIISGMDGNLGEKNDGFTYAYTISDSDTATVTVTESIDGNVIRSYVPVLNANLILNVSGNTWLSLANGVHTLKVTATDGVDTTVRTVTFTKYVTAFAIQNSIIMAASTRPTRIKVSVNRNIPPEATLKIYVCNNGFDSTPTWEDATSAMNNGLVHLFSNTTKTATQWGVKIRVTVNRNGGSGACYVTSIGGNWE